MNWLAFTNPLMLAGLAAVGLPLLIHYLTRARPKRIAFPPFKFLEEACAGQQALNRLRTIILLIIRTLFIAALVLLFSRPFLKPVAAIASPHAAGRVVVILDASFSMRAVQQGTSLFNRGQARAADLLRGLPAGSEAAVILEGASARPLLPALSQNIPALHDRLVKSSPTFENGDAAAAVSLAGKLLNGSGTLYVFSDFQKSNWENVRDWPAGITCRLCPVVSSAVDNVAITDATMTPATPVVGELVEISCRIFNCSPAPRQETARLDIDDISREARVTLEPFTSADATFNVTFSRPGLFSGKISLPPDSLAGDEVRYVTTNVRKSLQVLLINDVDDSDWNNAAFFISKALVPTPDVAPGIQLNRRRGQDLDRGALETADVFFLAGPAALSGEAVEIITRRVREGARLVVFLDDRSSGSLILPALNPAVQLQRLVQSRESDAVSITSPKVFPDIQGSDFNGIHFMRHYQTQTVAGRAGEVILSYADGAAALTISPVGEGDLVLVNLPLTPDGGDFVGSPLFPTLLHELLSASHRSAIRHTATPGVPWTVDVPDVGEGNLTVAGPDGKKVEARELSSGRSTRLALSPVPVPGIYAIKRADTLLSYAAMNIDLAESDTRPLAVKSLEGTNRIAGEIQSGDDALSVQEKARPLWPQLAGVAASLLGIEMLMLAFWRRSANVPAATVKKEVAP